MGDPIRVRSNHAEDLADGRTVESGGYARDVDLRDPVNKRLLDEDRIIKVAESDVPEGVPAAPVPPKLTGDALDQRARDLNIEGRTTLSADELRDAIAEKEEEAGQ